MTHRRCRCRRAELVPDGLRGNSREDPLVVSQEVKRIAIQQRRWNIGRPARAPPRNSVGAGDVTLRSIKSDRQQRSLLIAAPGEQHPIGRDRRRHHIRGKAAAFPNDFAVREVIAVARRADEARPVRSTKNSRLTLIFKIRLQFGSSVNSEFLVPATLEVGNALRPTKSFTGLSDKQQASSGHDHYGSKNRRAVTALAGVVPAEGKCGKTHHCC